MFDAKIRPLIDPPLNHVAKFIAGTFLTATKLTMIGFGIGVLGCALAVFQLYGFAVICLIINRFVDGLDGPVARLRGEESDFGGYLDILCDFIIYAGFPLAMACGIGTIVAFQAASFLLFTMVVCGVSFLAYAVIAEKKKYKTDAQGKKSFFFSFGLMEGAETIIFLLLMGVLPQYFVWIAVTFGVLCLMTGAIRTVMAYQSFDKFLAKKGVN